MSDTDIYKNSERPHTAPSTSPSPHRRRRSANHSTFGDTSQRKRRSKNSGFRRLLHLSRRSSNETSFWWGLMAAVVILLAALAVWQFWYVEKAARDQTLQDELHIPIQAPASATE